MKKLFLTTALLALIASPAVAATVTAELRAGADGGKSPLEYKLDYQAPFFQVFPNLNYGVELTTKQQPNNGTVASKAVARVGVDLPTVLGFNVGGNVQLGRNLEAATSSVVANKAVIKGGDYNLYGAEVNVSRALVAGITGDVGYRFRNGIESKGLDNQETRLNAGLSYEILPSYKIGVEYYRYSRAINPATGTKLFSQVALKLGHSF
jgi:opacity protein-like surface antigen